MTETTAYKILTADQWAMLSEAGRFAGAPVDLMDGYIHLSTASQVAETAAKHFGEQTGLMLVAVDLGVCGGAVRWEVSRGGALFPHLYDELTMAMVLWAEAMPLDADGRHVLPAGVAG